MKEAIAVTYENTGQMGEHIVKTLIFDFDGTLVDSMGQWAGKMLNILKVYGIAYPDDIIKTITPLGDKGTAEYFIRAFGISSTPDELIAMMDAYALPEYTDKIPAKETVPETLRELKNRGYRLCVLTASPHKMLDVCLKRLGLYDLFEYVWSCDDFKTTKGDVKIYNEAAFRLHTRVEDCIFLDDNIHALTVAKKAGMTVIGVYDESAEAVQTEIAALADAHIFQMKEILSVLPSISR